MSISDRAMAGTIRLSSSHGVYISSETVKLHKDENGNVTFKQLVGFEVKELYPGAAANVTAVWEYEPTRTNNHDH